MAKSGILRFNTEKISIGFQDKERAIIRQQIEFAENTCMSFLQHHMSEGIDKYRLWFVNEKIYDEIIKWISFNHITTNETYIEIKQNIILSIIATYTQKDYFITDEFRAICNKEVNRIIHKLVDIRQYYMKNGA